MKIVSVEAIPCRVPLKVPKRFATRTVSHMEYTIVEGPNRRGAHRLGLSWGPVVVARNVDDLLSEKLLGQDPAAIAMLWRRM